MVLLGTQIGRTVGLPANIRVCVLIVAVMHASLAFWTREYRSFEDLKSSCAF